MKFEIFQLLSQWFNSLFRSVIRSARVYRFSVSRQPNVCNIFFNRQKKNKVFIITFIDKQQQTLFRMFLFLLRRRCTRGTVWTLCVQKKNLMKLFFIFFFLTDSLSVAPFHFNPVIKPNLFSLTIFRISIQKNVYF